MTREEKIASLVLGYLGEISIANGYLSDVDEVYHWRSKIIPGENTSILNLKDGTNEYDLGDGSKEWMILKIETITKKADNYAATQKLHQDILKALTSNFLALQNAIGDNGMRLNPVEKIIIDQETEKEAEIMSGYVTVRLLHRVMEKWTLDETVY